MKKNEGFVGLILMLVSVAVLVLLIWKMSVSVQGSQEKNAIETDLKALQMTKDLKNSLDQRYK